MTTKRVYHTNRAPTPPGHFLARELEERGLTQGEFARRIGFSLQAVTDLIHARCTLSTGLATALSKELGTSSDLWLGLERRYREELARMA